MMIMLESVKAGIRRGRSEKSVRIRLLVEVGDGDQRCLKWFRRDGGTGAGSAWSCGRVLRQEADSVSVELQKGVI
jgi:hypothetical protein